MKRAPTTKAEGRQAFIVSILVTVVNLMLAAVLVMWCCGQARTNGAPIPAIGFRAAFFVTLGARVMLGRNT